MLKKVAVLAALLLGAFAILMLTTRETTFMMESVEQIDRPPRVVWQELAAVEQWPLWWPGVLRAELPTGWQEGAPLYLELKGNPEDAPAIITVHAPGREIAWVRGGVLGSSGRTRLRLSGMGGTTLVTMEISIQGPQAVLARVTGEEEFETYQQAVLQSLKVHLEEGGAPEN